MHTLSKTFHNVARKIYDREHLVTSIDGVELNLEEIFQLILKEF